MRENSSLIGSLALLPPTEQQAILAELNDSQIEELLWDWRVWARPNQIVPPGQWSTWVILAGRGFGKTRTGSETIREWVCGKTPMGRGRYHRIALIAETAADARDVIVEGDSGLLACHPKDFRPLYEPSKRRLTWPNGAVATLFNATEPDQLRGPQFDAGWLDELAKYDHAREVWDMFQFGLRLGNDPRSIVTTTPRGIPLIRELVNDKTSHVTYGRTMDNAANLADTFIKKIHDKYSGTRLGRQELEAEILDDIPGALWNRESFEPPPESGKKGRVKLAEVPPLVRIVVGVDPSGTSGGSDDGDSIGIVVAGIDEQDHGYVLCDATIKGSPDEWAQQAINCYYHFMADKVVAEINFGGAMVEALIRSKDRNVSYKAVRASRGKIVRAEPVAALYEQGKVSHVIGGNPWDKEDNLALLEDQMTLMAPQGFEGEGSPDRVDALVWALTELMLDNSGEAWILTRKTL